MLTTAFRNICLYRLITCLFIQSALNQTTIFMFVCMYVCMWVHTCKWYLLSLRSLILYGAPCRDSKNGMNSSGIWTNVYKGWTSPKVKMLKGGWAGWVHWFMLLPPPPPSCIFYELIMLVSVLFLCWSHRLDSKSPGCSFRRWPTLYNLSDSSLFGGFFLPLC